MVINPKPITYISRVYNHLDKFTQPQPFTSMSSTYFLLSNFSRMARKYSLFHLLMPRYLSQNLSFKLASLVLSYTIKIMRFARTQNESVIDL